MLFDAYGGAINSIAPGDTAFLNRDKLACLQYVAPWAPERVGVRRRSKPGAGSTASTGRCGPYVSGYAYLNYIDPKLADWQHAYYGANLASADERQSGGRPERTCWPLRRACRT